MKKFLGSLLVLIGTGLILWGVWAANSSSSIMMALISIICGVLGVVFILWGRKLYLANGESPKAKKVAGRFLTIIGIGLAIFGALWYLSEGLDSYNGTGDLSLILASLVAALVFLIVGTAKSHAAKKEARQDAVNSTTVPGRTSAASRQAKTPTPPPRPRKMVCAECGREYPMDHVYCDECGSLLREKF